jgi:hypothetical protein
MAAAMDCLKRWTPRSRGRPWGAGSPVDGRPATHRAGADRPEVAGGDDRGPPAPGDIRSQIHCSAAPGIRGGGYTADFEQASGAAVDRFTEHLVD